MIIYENNCVHCPQGCIHCGRDHQPMGVCDDKSCGAETDELFYGVDGGQYCKHCITGHLERVVIE